MENKRLFIPNRFVLAVLKVVIWLPIFAAPTLVLADTCPSDSIKALDRPVASGQTFNYSYRYRCVNPSLPTVIVIPGGPGDTSIDTSDGFIESANMIFTDPRGVGENKNFWSTAPSDRRVTTEQVADDIIAVIKARGLSNYVLHGHSFGTAVATVIASKAKADTSLAEPKVVVLEGTIGKALGDDEQNTAVNTAWSQIQTEAEYCITCQADSLKNTYSIARIGSLIEALIVHEGKKGTYLNHFMTRATPDQFQNVFDGMDRFLGNDIIRFYQDVGCNEFSRLGPTDVLYKGEKLESVSKGYCTSQKFDSPFDSKKWQTGSKIVYVSGTHDVATPFGQTLYHYNGQSDSSKSLVCVQDGGHSLFSASLSDCKQQVWSAILTADDRKINSALQQCEASASVTTPQACGQNAIH